MDSTSHKMVRGDRVRDDGHDIKIKLKKIFFLHRLC